MVGLDNNGVLAHTHAERDLPAVGKTTGVDLGVAWDPEDGLVSHGHGLRSLSGGFAHGRRMVISKRHRKFGQQAR